MLHLHWIWQKRGSPGIDHQKTKKGIFTDSKLIHAVCLQRHLCCTCHIHDLPALFKPNQTQVIDETHNRLCLIRYDSLLECFIYWNNYVIRVLHPCLNVYDRAVCRDYVIDIMNYWHESSHVPFNGRHLEIEDWKSQSVLWDRCDYIICERRGLCIQ